MVGDTPGHGEPALHAVEPIHRRVCLAAPGEIMGVPNRGRVPCQRIGVKANDHPGFSQSNMRSMRAPRASSAPARSLSVENGSYWRHWACGYIFSNFARIVAIVGELLASARTRSPGSAGLAKVGKVLCRKIREVAPEDLFDSHSLFAVDSLAAVRIVDSRIAA